MGFLDYARNDTKEREFIDFTRNDTGRVIEKPKATCPAGADLPNGSIPIKKYKIKKPPVLLVDFYCVKFAG